MIKPPAIKPGDTIGVVAPARSVPVERLHELSTGLQNAGFNVQLVKGVEKKHFQWAGTDAERAQSLHAAFLDPDIKAVICARGGYGSYRVLEYLDFDLIASNPKPFIGYSDITALLLAITGRTGLVTFHGPMMISFGDHDLAAENLSTLLLGISAVSDRFDDLHQYGTKIFQSGTAEGRLLGGNLELISRLMGTPDEPDFDDAILFVEDIGEELYRLDRALNQLHRAGKLEKVRGLIVGEFIDVYDTVGEGGFGMNVAQIIGQYVRPEIPVVLDAPCGHGRRLLTFPVGIPAKLQADRHAIRLSYESPVI